MLYCIIYYVNEYIHIHIKYLDHLSIISTAKTQSWKQDLFSSLHSMGHEFRSSFAVWFWLMMSFEAALKKSGGPTHERGE